MSIPSITVKIKPVDQQQTAQEISFRDRSTSAKKRADSSNGGSSAPSTPISLSRFAHDHLPSASSSLSRSAPSSLVPNEPKPRKWVSHLQTKQAELQFDHEHPASSSSLIGSSSVVPVDEPLPRKWFSHLQQSREKMPLPKLTTPILTLPQTSTSSIDPLPLEHFSGSLRSTEECCVRNVTLQEALQASTNKALEQLAHIRKGLHYGDMNLQEIDQTVELYFRQSVRKFINGDIRQKDLFRIIHTEMTSETSPLVSICCRHLGKYALALSDTNSILKELKSVIVAMVTLNRASIRRFEVPDHEETPLDTLIAILQKYSKHHIGAVLSYLILGSTENQIEQLLEILKKWSSIDEGRMASKIKEIKGILLYPHLPNESHQFIRKDIRETYVRDAGVVLPHMLTINSLPFRLNGYEGGRDKMLADLLYHLISDIHYAGLNLEITEEEIRRLVDDLLIDNDPPLFLRAMLSGDEIERLVDDFRENKGLYHELVKLLDPVLFRQRMDILFADMADETDNKLHTYLKAVLSQDAIEGLINDFREQKEYPEEFRDLLDPVQIQRKVDDFLIKRIAPPKHLQTLLGLGTISSRIQAFIFFLSTFPSLGSNGFICRQKQGNVRIFFNVKSDSVNCFQPIALIVYPKMSDDLQSFAINQDRPLAEVTIGWTGAPRQVEGAPDSYTHSETLEILNCEFYEESFPEERKRILASLDLQKRFTIKPTLTNRPNTPSYDFKQLTRPPSLEADNDDRLSSVPSSSSSTF